MVQPMTNISAIGSSARFSIVGSLSVTSHTYWNPEQPPPLTDNQTFGCPTLFKYSLADSVISIKTAHMSRRVLLFSHPLLLLLVESYGTYLLANRTVFHLNETRT